MWVIFSLAASVLWGLSYVLFEQIYKKVAVTTALAITCLVMFIVMVLASYFQGRLTVDLTAITSSKKLLWLVAAGVGTALLADLFIGLSIHAKNATLAGLIEISYPIFIALFAYLLFKENQINTATIIGGLLVFAGVFVIYFFNK
jgi:uncharacterized membrane protein